MKDFLNHLQKVWCWLFALLLFVSSSSGTSKITTPKASPFQVAVENNEIGKVKELIKWGYDVNGGCCTIGSSKLMKLTRHGYDVSKINRLGRQPLHWVRSLGIAKILVKNGANVSARDNAKSTPLHLASNLEIAKFLVNKGADVNAQDNDGNTPLHFARNLELAKLFIEMGARVNTKRPKQTSL